MVCARLAGALIVVVAALIASGCGDGETEEGRLSNEDYDGAVEGALKTFGALEELEPPAAEADAVDSYVAEVRQIFDTALQDLRAIEPPEDVESIHEDLIAAIETYGAAFPPIADAAKADDRAALQSAATDLQAAAFDFKETATDLDQQFKDQGIDLQSLAG